MAMLSRFLLFFYALQHFYDPHNFVDRDFAVLFFVGFFCAPVCPGFSVYRASAHSAAAFLSSSVSSVQPKTLALRRILILLPIRGRQLSSYLLHLSPHNISILVQNIQTKIIFILFNIKNFIYHNNYSHYSTLIPLCKTFTLSLCKTSSSLGAHYAGVFKTVSVCAIFYDSVTFAFRQLPKSVLAAILFPYQRK